MSERDELREYVAYLHGYICELAKRTDIPVVPQSFDQWRAAPERGDGPQETP